jgi:alpha-ketoglutarate-dependent taurine dioxygenase
MSTSEPASPAQRPTWSKRREAVKPTPITAEQAEWVTLEPLCVGEALPLLARPALRAVDLAAWAAANWELLEERLARHGGILFRGFDLQGQADFERVVHALPVQLTGYQEGATPRTKLGEKVYTSTEFPAEHSIALHNELSYVTTWPLKIWFFCLTPPATGGETPIADVRRVFQRLPPTVRERFADKGWMLVRNFRPGLGPSWQSSYLVADRAAAEEYFRLHAIDWKWTGEDRLRTRQVRPAIARHPRTGDLLWFNHVAFWHVSSLEPGVREVLLRDFGEENLPYNTYYGDGAVIEDEVVAALRDAYELETRAFAWQPGDLLMLDNMLVAHGRRPFGGPRRILTAMGEPCSERGV